ncbi:MAG: xanthine dehydrogenase molybdopterin binding subunit, partial [Methylobacteriaceae bacterium]|nr:xanthine dehydrogenase molybdopterin binding subunit [Methylobacteriaceae bacterium]
MPPSETSLLPPETEEGLAVVRKPIAHDSARLHVQGAATYVDDIREPDGTLHLAVGLAPAARGRLVALDLDPVRAAPGVVRVLTAADIPGKNDVSPAFGDDPMFADAEVSFHGQVLFAVVATTRDAARRGARLARIEIAAERPMVTTDDALAENATVLPDYAFGRGDVEGGLAEAPRYLEGRFRI